jgi:hypothetical protein
LPDSFKIAALEIAHNKVSPRPVHTPRDRSLIYVLLDGVSERIEGKKAKIRWNSFNAIYRQEQRIQCNRHV